MSVSLLPQTLADQNVVFLRGHDLVLDALDNIPARLVMEDACAELNIPIAHGAIDGWCAQTAVVPPKSGMLHQERSCNRRSCNRRSCNRRSFNRRGCN